MPENETFMASRNVPGNMKHQDQPIVPLTLEKAARLVADWGKADKG